MSNFFARKSSAPGRKKRGTPVRFWARLSTKAFLAVLLFASVTLYSADVFFLSFFEDNLRRNIGENAVLIAQRTVDEIELAYVGRFEYVEAMATRGEFKDVLVRSNRSFEVIEDRDAYITQSDRAWVNATSGTTTALMRRVLDNGAAAELRVIARYFAERYDRTVFAEVFLTNRYGVNAAQTSRTSDYFQADEAWWQTAREHGRYTSSVFYDESADTYATRVAISLYDTHASGSDVFLGVLTAVVDIGDATAILKDVVPSNSDNFSQGHLAHGHASHRSARAALLQGPGNTVLYSTGGALDLGSLVSRNHFEMIGDNQDGYFIQDVGPDKERLVAHAYSPLLDITLLLDHDVSEITAATEFDTERSVVLLTLGLGLFYILILLFLARYIIRPLSQLSDAASRVTQGDFSVRVPTARKDEIGHFARVFNNMTEMMQHAQEKLERQVKDRTAGLLLIQKELQDKLAELERFQELTVDRELKMIELKKQLEALQRQLDEPRSANGS